MVHVPHALIALESGAVSGVDEVIHWSPVRHPAQTYWPKDWAQSQTLSSAFERSVAWYFQELVPRIGEPTYARWLKRFRYGNAASPPNDRSFWLDGTLSVSPNEQVEFLSCVLTEGCGVSSHTISILDAIAFEDQQAGLRLYGKTGSGPRRSGDMDATFRRRFSRLLLTQLGLWPRG